MGGIVTDVMDTGVVMQTKTGKSVPVWPWTDPDTGVTFYPLRPGYASNLHKVQGATLEHITVWLDAANIESAAYVALSRVEVDDNWRFIGDPGVHHFTPASGW